MKKRYSRTAILGIAGLAIAVLLAINPVLAEDEQTATVTFLEGSAKAKLGPTGDWNPLAKGAKLTAKYKIKTEKGSKIELTLPDGSILRIAPRSVVRLKSLLGGKLMKSGKSSLKINTGKIWANVSKTIGGERKFEVETNNAVAGVRGTVFRVNVEKDKSTLVRVYSGAVAVSKAQVFERKPKKAGSRVQVEAPKQVSREKWEEIVAKEMQQVRVTSDGRLAMSPFTKEEDQNNWVAWNEEMDSKLSR